MPADAADAPPVAEEPTLEPEPPALRSDPATEPEAPTLEPEPPTFRDIAPTDGNTSAGQALEPSDAPIASPPSIAAAVGAAPAVPLSASTPAPVATSDGTEPQSGRQPSKIERRLAQLGPAVAAGAVTEPAIGVVDARLFDCPACGRPLARGTSRCTNCGIRLVGGRPLRRVATFAAIAVVAVLVLGGVGMTVLAMSPSNPSTGTVPTASPPASQPTTTAEAPSAAPVTPAIPAGAAAALSGTAVVNARIATDAAGLARTLSNAKTPTIDVARAMRALAADAQLGLDMTGRLVPWTDAAAVTAKLNAFYRGLADKARDALRASLTDATGYRRAGAELLAQVRGIDAVDAASRELAAGAGLTLPPLSEPAGGSASPES